MASWLDLPAHRAWLAGADRPAARVRAPLARPRRLRLARRGRRARPDRPPQLWITARMTHVFALGELLGLAGLRAARRPRAARARRALRRPRARRLVRRAGAGRPQGGLRALVRAARRGERAIAGRPAGARSCSTTASPWSNGASGPRRRARRSRPGTARGARPSRTAAPTRTCTWSRRSSPRPTRPATPSGCARGTDRRAADGRRARARLARRRALRRRLGAATGLQPRRPAPPLPPLRRHPGARARVVAAPAAPRAALPDPPGWLLEAARGLFARAVADGWAPTASSTRPTSTGGPSSRTGCHWVVAEAIGAAATLHAVTGERGLRRVVRARLGLRGTAPHRRRARPLAPRARRRAAPGEATWSGKPDVYHAFQATLVPRLPPRPSLAGALRDAPLT